MAHDYPVRLIPEDEGGFRVNFRDVPEALTQGDSVDEALAEAADCLVVALTGYIQARRPIPKASAAEPGEHVIALAPLIAAKLALYEAAREAGLNHSSLAQRLGVAENAVRRLIALNHRSHIGQVDQALAALGKRLVVDVRDAA